ncbi:hypothetical protein FF1_001289 [Malus domestica]
MSKLLASGAVAGFLETAELIKTWDDNGSDKLALNVFMNKTYAANALVLLASSSALTCFSYDMCFLIPHQFSDTKYLIERIYSDPSLQNYMKLRPFKVTEGPAEKPMFVVTHEDQ